MPAQVRSGSLLSSSPETPGGYGPYLTGRGLHQTLCLAQSGCQEPGTQEGHKHKRFLSPDNLFSQTKVSDSCLNPQRKARAEITAMQKRVFLGPARNNLSSPLLLKKVLFPNFSRYANSTSWHFYLGLHEILSWHFSIPPSTFSLPNVLFYYRNNLHF